MSNQQEQLSISAGGDSDQVSPKSDVSRRSRTLINTTKSFLLLGLCILGVSSRGLLASRTTSAESSADALLDQISKLTKDLDAFEQLKKQYISDEIELGWDRQHIADLETRISDMSKGFAAFEEYEHIFENGIQTETMDMQKALSENLKRMGETREKDKDILNKLAHEIRDTSLLMEGEKAENAGMRHALQYMTEEIERTKNAKLRGTMS